MTDSIGPLTEREAILVGTYRRAIRGISGPVIPLVMVLPVDAEMVPTEKERTYLERLVTKAAQDALADGILTLTSDPKETLP